MSQRYLGALYLATAASIWGGMYVVSKVVLETIPPMALVWVRYMIALVVLATAGILTKQSWRIRRTDIPLVLVIGIIGYAISIWTQFLGTKLSSAQFGAIITSATPAFMVVFARFLLGEKVTWQKALSVVLATSGVFMIVGIGDVNHAYRLGGLVLVIAALTWALMSVLVKRVPSGYSQLIVTTYAIFIATFLLSPVAIFQLLAIPVWELARPSVWGGTLYLGIVSTAGAFFLWNKGLQMVDAGSGGLYFFFQPLVGSLLGWWILNEQVSLSFWIGAFLILTGVLFTLRNPT